MRLKEILLWMLMAAGCRQSEQGEKVPYEVRPRTASRTLTESPRVTVGTQVTTSHSAVTPRIMVQGGSIYGEAASMCYEGWCWRSMCNGTSCAGQCCDPQGRCVPHEAGACGPLTIN